jgi:hypothetical protein
MRGCSSMKCPLELRRKGLSIRDMTTSSRVPRIGARLRDADTTISQLPLRRETEQSSCECREFGSRQVRRSAMTPTQRNPMGLISPVAEARQLAGLDPKGIFAAVADFCGLDAAALLRRHDPHLARGRGLAVP